MNLVFKPKKKVRDEIIEYYSNFKNENTPPYAILQAREFDTTITVYESGKIMFQGLSADIDARKWFSDEYIKKTKAPKEPKKLDISHKKILISVGSDEVGTGDYFGPIIVTASFVAKEHVDFLKNLKIQDSKKISDEEIKKLAPLLIKNIPHFTYMLKNEEYNNIEDVNLNKVKALLHNRALYNLIKKLDIKGTWIIIDKFCSVKNYYSYIADQKEKVHNIRFMEKADNFVLSVSVSSIISRFFFLKEIDNISKQLGVRVPLGAGEIVNDFASELILKHGEDILKNIAKINFKNTKKIKDKVNQPD